MRKQSTQTPRLFFVLPFLMLLADAFAAPLEIDVLHNICPIDGEAVYVQNFLEDSAKFKERLESDSPSLPSLFYELLAVVKGFADYLPDPDFLHFDKDIVNISLSERGPPILLP